MPELPLSNGATAPAIEAGTVARADRSLATCGLVIATAMQAADAVIVNVALPHLEHDLGGGVDLGAWVMTSYLCATAVAAPLTAWLRRRYGARRLFPGAVAGFTIASLLCAMAPSSAAIIAFRVLQGAGGGIILPLAQAILLEIYPQERHARMLAIWGAALMIGPVLGPLLGGIITDLTSWRGVFVINLPLGIAVIWMLRRLHYREEIAALPIDGLAVGLLVVAVGALQLCLQRGVGRSWFDSPELLGEAAIVVLSVSLLALRSRRAGFTVFRPDVFKDVNFAAAAFYNFMTSGLLFVTIVFIPALGEGPLGYRATLAGFTIVPRAVLMMLMMLSMGQLIGKIDRRILLACGWVLMAAGLAILANIHPAQGIAWIVTGSTIQAIGAGMLFTPLSTFAYSTLPAELRTDAAGVYSLLRQLGFATGVAVMTPILQLIIQARLAASGGALAAAASPELVAAATLGAYARCFGLMAIAAVAVLPGVLVFRDTSQPAATRNPA
jgi:DHA2 family multidrug resistance protein